MLFRDKMQQELDAKSAEFRDFLTGLFDDVGYYASTMAELEGLPYGEIERRLGGDANIGAMPSPEIGTCSSFGIAFDAGWRNHEQARNWALGVLDGRTTFAADGSQIYAAKKTSVPVAAIQIGWFENPHDETRPYAKGASFDILTPDDLFRGQEDPMNPDIRVEERRYLGEVGRVGEFLKERKGWRERGERMPLAFFDNPLLVPFSQKGLQNSFLRATVDLVNLSRETRVPVVGYVDRSFSRDLISLLDHFGGRTGESAAGLYDASLLFRSQRSAWGGRSCYFYSRRRGLQDFIDPATGVSSVGFCYLQTTADSAPARLDVPSWVYEEGLLDEVVDVARAECVVGLGYPYALESADHAAVISAGDREVFFRALQEFASREKLDFSVSRKDESKQRRR
jgi:hypothetical protein